ncbi:MAG: metallophosphoesterase [Elusimicrobia bacterium]|nr:metallophosphoesterase [Candidatus Obscuribacterium magneticum]
MKHFFMSFLSILVVLFLYTGYKVRPFFPERGWLAWLVTGLLFFVMLGWHGAGHSSHFSPDSNVLAAIAWVGSFSMGVWATFIIFSIPFDIGNLLFYVARKLLMVGPEDSLRKMIFSRWIPLSLTGLSLAIALLGLWQALAGPRVKEVVVAYPDLPSGLEKLRIVQISDLHVSPTHQRPFIEKVVREVMSLKPDLIVFTGDLADGPLASVAPSLEPLSNLKAPLGVYAVTGNHEHFGRGDPWIQELKALGFTPLINENRIVNFEGVPILIAGITDSSGHTHYVEPAYISDLGRAAATAVPVKFRILLAHDPGNGVEAEKAGFQLQLSAHTHGGQFFPFNLLVRLFKPIYKGLNRRGSLWIYVNPGTGFWGPPNRFGIPAEITLLKLKG